MVISESRISNRRVVKPLLWITWLAKGCPIFTRKKYQREPQSVSYNFNPSNHDNAKQLISKNMIKKGYEVEVEKKIIADFGFYKLGAFIDIYAKKKEEPNDIVIEIKYKDSTYYEMQYKLQNVILKEINIDHEYWVYEYKKSNWVMKSFENLDSIQRTISERIKLVLDSDSPMNPETIPFCQYCSYWSCTGHPNHQKFIKEPSFV